MMHAIHAQKRRSAVRTLMLTALGLAIVVGAAGAPWSRAAAAPAAGAVTRLGGFRQASTRLWAAGGKPVMFFMGAQFCQFCAAERWAFVRATERFGRWSGLEPTSSSGGTGGVPTFDTLHATYHSALITVQTREIADFHGRPLQALSARQGAYVNAYDPSGGFPLIVIAGRYVQLGNGPNYGPHLFIGRSFAAAHHLVYDQPASVQARAVVHEANIMSALICASMGARARTTSACHAAGVRGLLSGQ